MTPILTIRTALFALALLALPGCLELDVDTTIHDDGSSDRRISLTRPVNTLPSEAFPRTTGAGWKGEWSADSGKKNSYLYTATKHFATPEELMAEYNNTSDSGAMSSHITLEKKFQWFYTYIDYREVYRKMHRPYRVPIERYMTPDEMHRYLRGEKSDSLENRMKEWADRDGFELVFESMVAGANRLNDPSLPASLLEQHKEELFQLFRDDQSDTAKGKKGSEKKDEVMEGLQKISTILKTQTVMLLKPELDSAVALMMTEDDRYKSPDSWSCMVRMPGMLLETDGTSVEGTTITWKLKSGQLRCGDYEMHAVSRIANVWAFILTGVAVLLIVVLTFVRARGRSVLPGV
jgi:hypothetical protein